MRSLDSVRFIDRPIVIHTARRTISSLILPIAFVGFQPLGAHIDAIS